MKTTIKILLVIFVVLLMAFSCGCISPPDNSPSVFYVQVTVYDNEGNTIGTYKGEFHSDSSRDANIFITKLQRTYPGGQGKFWWSKDKSFGEILEWDPGQWVLDPEYADIENYTASNPHINFTAVE